MQFAGKNHENVHSLLSTIVDEWFRSNDAATSDEIKNLIISTSAEDHTYKWMARNTNYKAHLIDWKITEDQLRQGLVTAFGKKIENTLKA